MELRPKLREIDMPARMRELPVDKRGFPVPWFVEWVKGEPEFRAMDIRKKFDAVNKRLCWVCGQAFTNRRRHFLIGPMCCVNRNTAEPPCHLECAVYSARGCPFLTMPKMVRREGGMEKVQVQEGHIARNPGAMAIYQTRSFNPYFPDPKVRNFLIELGEPENITWWAEGRAATRAEVEASIQSGLPRTDTTFRRQLSGNTQARLLRHIGYFHPRNRPQDGCAGGHHGGQAGRSPLSKASVLISSPARHKSKIK